jgi:hypothetical protein
VAKIESPGESRQRYDSTRLPVEDLMDRRRCEEATSVEIGQSDWVSHARVYDGNVDDITRRGDAFAGR